MDDENGRARSAAAAVPTDRQCFRPDMANGFTPVDRDTVDVTVAGGRVYRLELFTSCSDINWTQTVAIRSRGSSWICTGERNDAELLVPGAIIRDRCLVNSIRRLSDAEVEAMRRPRN